MLLRELIDKELKQEIKTDVILNMVEDVAYLYFFLNGFQCHEISTLRIEWCSVSKVLQISTKKKRNFAKRKRYIINWKQEIISVPESSWFRSPWVGVLSRPRHQPRPTVTQS